MSKYVSALAFAKQHPCDASWLNIMQSKAVKLLKRGDTGQFGEFPATVVKHYVDGMYEVRVPGGLTTISSAEFKPLKPMDMTAEEFTELFQPVKNPNIPNGDGAFDGCMFETYGVEYAFVAKQYERDPYSVWTIMDADEDEIEDEEDGQVRNVPVLHCGLHHCWPAPIGYLVCAVAHDGKGSVRVD